MPGISQALTDALNKAEADAATAKSADAQATASSAQAAQDQAAAQTAHATALASYQAALLAFYQEFSVTPPAPTP